MKLKKTIKYFFIAGLLVAFGYYSPKLFLLTNNYTGNATAVISNENSAKGKILGEDVNQFPSQMFESQNYQSPQIMFGGDAITFPAGQQAEAPEILDMRSELLMTKSDQQVRFLLTWKTNKPCRSQIAYMKEGQSEGKTVSDDGYGFVHSAEISPLNFSTSYYYTVTARDKWGKEIKSDKLAFYTGAPNVSIFDLVGSAFKDMFGWAGR